MKDRRNFLALRDRRHIKVSVRATRPSVVDHGFVRFQKARGQNGNLGGYRLELAL